MTGYRKGQGFREGLPSDGHVLITLIVVMISQVYVYVKTEPVVQFKYMLLIKYQLFLKKHMQKANDDLIKV